MQVSFIANGDLTDCINDTAMPVITRVVNDHMEALWFLRPPSTGIPTGTKLQKRGYCIPSTFGENPVHMDEPHFHQQKFPEGALTTLWFSWKETPGESVARDKKSAREVPKAYMSYCVEELP